MTYHLSINLYTNLCVISILWKTKESAVPSESFLSSPSNVSVDSFYGRGSCCPPFHKRLRSRDPFSSEVRVVLAWHEFHELVPREEFLPPGGGYKGVDKRRGVVGLFLNRREKRGSSDAIGNTPPVRLEFRGIIVPLKISRNRHARFWPLV